MIVRLVRLLSINYDNTDPLGSGRENFTTYQTVYLGKVGPTIELEKSH